MSEQNDDQDVEQPEAPARGSAGAGRPTDCTPEATKAIAQAISLGLTFRDAAEAADVTYQTFRNWMKRGLAEAKRVRAAGRKAKPHKKEQPYFDFFYAIKRAKAKGEKKLVQTIYQHAALSWQAAAWILERRYPKRYAQRVKSEITGKDGGPVQHATVTLVLPDNGRGDAQA